MAQFTKGRFQARLYAFCWTILETRQPNFDAEKIKAQNWILTVLQAMDYASEAEKDVIHRLPDVLKTKPDTEDQRDSMLGAVEGKIVVYEKLDPHVLLEEKEISTKGSKSNPAPPKPSKSKIILWSCIAAIVIGIIIYNLPMCEEYRDYKIVVNADSVYEYVEACDTYLEKYQTHGKHSGDVMYLKVTRTKYDILVMADYLRAYPDHKFHADVKSKYDARWEEEIAKYER